MLINTTLIIVEDRLKQLLKGFDCCKCEKCIDDMMAISLNHLKPAYVNTPEGMLFKRLDSSSRQVSADMDIEIIKAINMVSKSPQHLENANSPKQEEQVK